MAGSIHGFVMGEAVLDVVPRRSLLGDAWQRLAANRMTVGAIALLGLLILCAMIGPSLSRYALDQVDWSLGALSTPPSIAHGHWFGTDANGRDLFVRVWMGTRVSLLVAL